MKYSNKKWNDVVCKAHNEYVCMKNSQSGEVLESKGSMSQVVNVVLPMIKGTVLKNIPPILNTRSLHKDHPSFKSDDVDI